MKDYSQLFIHGNQAQLEKLKENESTEGFDNIDIQYAMTRLYEEHVELHNLLIDDDNEEWRKKLDYEQIRREAADVANFAHMIILKCDKELVIQ